MKISGPLGEGLCDDTEKPCSWKVGEDKGSASSRFAWSLVISCYISFFWWLWHTVTVTSDFLLADSSSVSAWQNFLCSAAGLQVLSSRTVQERIHWASGGGTREFKQCLDSQVEAFCICHYFCRLPLGKPDEVIMFSAAHWENAREFYRPARQKASPTVWTICLTLDACLFDKCLGHLLETWFYCIQGSEPQIRFTGGLPQEAFGGHRRGWRCPLCLVWRKLRAGADVFESFPVVLQEIESR